MNNGVKQQVIVISYNSTGYEIETKVNKYLDEGWKIVSVTPQHVSTGGWFPISRWIRHRSGKKSLKNVL